MASFVVDNNVESLVADDPLTSGAVTLNVNTGHGARFPSTFPYRLTVWDDSTYPDPTDDPNMEVVNCTGRSTDALTIARGEEGTSGVEHALGSRVALLFTAGVFNDATYGITTKLDTIDTDADVTGDNPPQTHAMSTHSDEGALSTLDTVDTAQIDDDAVTYSKMQNVVGDDRILGRVTGPDGRVEELTATQVLAMIEVDKFADITGTNQPMAHAGTHKSGLGDEILLDELGTPTDVATLNASTSTHGLLKKLDNSSTNFLNGQGNWAEPAGGGAHKDSHDPEDGADPLDTAAPSELAEVQAAGTGSSHSLARSDHVHAVNHAITNNHLITIDDTDAADNDYAKFTTSGLEGRSYSEVISDLSLGNALNASIWLPAEAAYLPATNPAGLVEELGATTYAGHSHLTFDDTTSEHAVWRVPMPDYDGGNIVVTAFSKVATTPSGVVTLQYNILTIGLATSEAFDAASTVDTTVNISHSLGSDDLLTDIVIHSATIDPANVAADDLLVIELSRDVASDTLVGDGELVGIMLEYSRT